MPKRVLQIIDAPYRCTIEEQDDPAVWITHALRGAGGDLGLLLRGSAVNYAVRGQDASGLRFGHLGQKHPPRVDRDLTKLLEKGVEVHVVEEDAVERGIEPGELIPGVQPVSRAAVAGLLDRFDHVWHW